MKLGVSIRLMGAAATREIVAECARAADAAGLDDLWVPDHIAIPPDDAEGSGGRYLDPLASLAWLAGITEHIGLGTGVLILPYRAPLPTAKWIATIQELSGGRMRLGVGIGWMKAEFKALGVPRSGRGRIADATLDLLHRCFAAEDDVVVEHEQPFLFRPRPARPPIFIGGAGDHALARTIRHGDGWMPMIGDPGRLADEIRRLHEMAEQAGRPAPEVVSFGAIATDDPGRGAEQLRALSRIGVTRVVAGRRYDDVREFRRLVDGLVAVREAAA